MIKLDMTPDTSLNDIQKNFAHHFPFLKIEFFHKPHQQFESNAKVDMITDHHKKLGDLTTRALNVTLFIDTGITVAQFEQMFESKLHLHIQVFYKSGNVWLESINSDSTKLHMLNEKAKLKAESKIENEEPGDYHEQP